MRNRERKIAAFWRLSFHQGAGTDSSGIASFPIPYSPFPVSKFQPAHLVAGELHTRREAVNASKESKNKCPNRNSPQPAARRRRQTERGEGKEDVRWCENRSTQFN